MTDVSLSIFRFALPTKVESNSEERIKASTEFPQEFLGLPPKEQVAVIGSLLRVVERHLCEMGTSSEEKFDESDWTPMYIGISVVLKKNPRLVIDAEFNFPDMWNKVSLGVRKDALRSFIYLMQIAGVSVVKREEKYGAAHA